MRWVAGGLVLLVVTAGCLVANGQAGGTLGPTGDGIDGLQVAYGPDGTLVQARLFGPTGLPVVHAVAGEQGRLNVAGVDRIQGPARLVLEGDPLSDDRVVLHVVIDGQRWAFEVGETPAQAYRDADEATGGHVLVRSPLAPPPTNLTLRAGPVTLVDEGGWISPRADVDVLVRVQAQEEVGRGSLVLGDRSVAGLTHEGWDGSGQVLRGVVPAWQVPDRHGEARRLAVRFTSELAPGLFHVQEAATADLVLDDQGPGTPQAVAGAANVTWSPVQGAVTYEATASNASVSRALPVDGTAANASGLPEGRWSVQVRAIDAVGNQGAWSPPVAITLDGLDPEAPRDLSLDLDPLTAGGPISGAVQLSWSGQAPVAEVVLEVSPDGGRSWLVAASAQQPPLVWHTPWVPDGTYLARVTVQGPQGTSAWLVPGVVVDNLLDPPGPVGPGGGPGMARAPEAPAVGPGSPLPVALAWGIGAIGLVGVLGGVVSAWRDLPGQKGTGK